MTFTTHTLRFLSGLKKHNNKPWFEAHRDDYELFVKAPMRDLIEEVDARLARFAPEICGDPKKSMFRIYRDIRFSKDKSPYKTHASCWFFHRDGTRGVGREASGGGAGFYFQVAPGQCFLGGGIWMPPRDALNRIRDVIAEHPKPFAKIALEKKVVKRFGGLGTDDMLKRLPRGVAEHHPAAPWMRHQSFLFGREMRESEALSPKLGASLEADYRLMVPLIRFVNSALGLKPAATR